MPNNTTQKTRLEITAISAQNIKQNNPSCSTLFPFSTRRRRLFITVTTFPSPTPPCDSVDGATKCGFHATWVNDDGGANPTSNDKFHIQVDSTFFTNAYSCVYVKLYTKRALLGQTLMGWIQIPAADLLDGLLPPGAAHHLSYRLRKKDGSRGHEIVNVTCKVVGQEPVVGRLPTCFYKTAAETWTTVTGVPVKTWQMDRGNNRNMDDRQ